MPVFSKKSGVFNTRSCVMYVTIRASYVAMVTVWTIWHYISWDGKKLNSLEPMNVWAKWTVLLSKTKNFTLTFIHYSYCSNHTEWRTNRPTVTLSGRPNIVVKYVMLSVREGSGSKSCPGHRYSERVFSWFTSVLPGRFPVNNRN